MLSVVDRFVFPDDCLVLEITPGSHYIYPIFKNGSTSLKTSRFRALSISELQSLECVDVFVRDPWERFLSGVNTYLSQLDPKLDQQTAMYFIKNYFFFNRHFMPQLFWLINLRRFSKTKIHIHHLKDLKNIVSLNSNQSSKNETVNEYFKDADKIKFYLEMDEVLTVNLINQTVEFDEIIDVLKQNYQETWQEIFQYSKNIIDVVR